MENIVSESDEIAQRIQAPRGSTFEDCREIVCNEMPDETQTVIDNVTESVFRAAHSYPC